MSGKEPRLYQLLLHLRERGGVLLSASSCPVSEIQQARMAGRYTEDADGYGYVLRVGKTST